MVTSCRFYRNEFAFFRFSRFNQLVQFLDAVCWLFDEWLIHAIRLLSSNSAQKATMDTTVNKVNPIQGYNLSYFIWQCIALKLGNFRSTPDNDIFPKMLWLYPTRSFHLATGCGFSSDHPYCHREVTILPLPPLNKVRTT